MRDRARKLLSEDLRLFRVVRGQTHDVIEAALAGALSRLMPTRRRQIACYQMPSMLATAQASSSADVALMRDR